MGAIASLKEVWNGRELRALVLLSLTLQIILIIMGNRRKYINNIWITILVWFPYLIADAVATTALGVLTRNTFVEDGCLGANMELHAFWAPFLLLHLGGPDTITAYSLEDNELWARHLLQLAVQTGFAVYIFLMAWTGSLLSILSIPILFAGLLKYGERTWVLWSASFEQRRVYGSIDVDQRSISVLIKDLEFGCNEDEGSFLAIAYGLGKLIKSFLADLIIEKTSFDLDMALSSIRCHVGEEKYETAIKVIEMGLGFMYDELYTKAMVTYTPGGIALRFVSFLLSCIVLILFSVSYHKQNYSKADLYITFILLTVAVFLELYAAVVALSSNQSIAWLTTHQRSNISKAIKSSLQRFRNPLWSNRMGQFSMLNYFFNEKPMGFHRFLLSCLPKRCHKIPSIFTLKRYLKIQEYKSYEETPEDLKLFLVRCVLEEYNKSTLDKNREPMRSSRGKRSLKCNGFECNSGILADIIKMDVELSIIIWHIATEFSFELDAKHIEDLDKSGNAETEQGVYHNIGLCIKMTKYISKYMMHLLAFSPCLLRRSGAQCEVPLKHALEIGRELSRRWKTEAIIKNIKKFYRFEEDFQSFETDSQDSGADFYDFRKIFTDSVLLSHAGHLLYFFSSHCNEQEQEKFKLKWRTICGVWMELLAYISIECTGNQHAQQLREGGELLTHFYILMALFGLTQHYPLEVVGLNFMESDLVGPFSNLAMQLHPWDVEV